MSTTITKKHNRNRCSFAGCGRSKASHPTLHFFSFPVNRPSICEAWVTNCANEALESCTKTTLNKKIVCEKHFNDDCFLSTLKTRLHACAIPTLLTLPDETSTNSNQSDQLQGVLSSTEVTIIANEEHTPKPRRTLFPAPLSPSSPRTPRTPLYKKFKRVKDRKQTPKSTLSPSKRRLLQQINSLRKINKTYQQKVKRLQNKETTISKELVMTAVKNMLPEKVSKFMCMQLKHADTRKMKWTEEEKQQALAMRYKSPALYEQMRSDGFALPSSSTIARWLQDIDLRPGVCPEIIAMIRNKVHHMSEWEKNAVLIFDEISIKSSLEYDSKRDVIEGLLDLGDEGRKPCPATHVLLFMARGLSYRWKMPVAYFATNNTVNADMVAKLVPKCISALQGTGLLVKALVCDQSSVNRKTIKLLNISSTAPYFEVNGQKIFFMFDFPHIVKCLRNNLMKKKNGGFVGQIVYDKTSTSSTDQVPDAANIGVADWAHIDKLYQIDSSAIKSRATKLTEKHVQPNSFEKMSVKLATQVFSMSVSAAMRTAVVTGELPSSALETADFLQRINNMFDVMNSKTKFNPNPYRCAISSSTNDHLRTPMDTLLADIEWVKSLKMLKDRTRPPCMYSMELSLLSTKLLWDDIKADGAKYLLTGRLNQDPIENEFSVARQKCGFERNPSVRLFRQNLKHRIQAALVQPPAGANCEPDDDDLLTTSCATTEQSHNTSASELTTVSPPLVESQLEGEQSAASDTDDDNCTDLESFKHCLESCSVRYFTGYGVQSCLKRFQCTECRGDLVKQLSAPDSADESLIRNKEYVKDKRSLAYPCDETADVVDIALSVLDTILKKKIHLPGFRKLVCLKVKQRVFKMYPEWMKANSECYLHRSYILNKIVLAKLKRSLQSMSNKLRQPGGKYGGHWEKICKLKNK